MLKNVLIGGNSAYTSAASPSLLTSGQIGVYGIDPSTGAMTLTTTANVAAQKAAGYDFLIAQGVPAGKGLKSFVIKNGMKKAYLASSYLAPVPNVFTVGYDGVTAAYSLASGAAGTYDFKIQNLTLGNTPYPTIGSTPFFQTSAAATPVAIANSIVKDVNYQMLTNNNNVMPEMKFAFVEVLSAATTAAPTSTPTATVTNGSTTVTLSTTSVDLVNGAYIKFGSATATTAAIYQIESVSGTTLTLASPYVNTSIAVGASISGLVTGFATAGTINAANAGIRVTEFGNIFNGSQVLEPMPNKILNVSCNVNLSGTPVQNNKMVARAYTLANGGVVYTSAAGATSSGITVTVGSTVGLYEGMAVTVTAGTGAFAAGTTVTNVLSATQFNVSAVPTTALSGGASVVTGTPAVYTEGKGTYPQVFKAELIAAGYSGFINRIFLPDNFPLYSTSGEKYVTLGLEYFAPAKDYTAQGFSLGESLDAIIGIYFAAPQIVDLNTILAAI